MSKICYQSKRFSDAHRTIIQYANQIIAEYAAQGYDLTLRQLYYQFVSRDIIANAQTEYKRLGSIINDARLAGLIDWDAIVDRTRSLRENSHWTSPGDIVAACAAQYRVDLWKNQSKRVEVWIEKDALVGVIEGVCEELDVPFFSCRGYSSQSAMWRAGQRINERGEDGQETLIIHLGDHDPSGMDMSRDIIDRLELFADDRSLITLHRVALNFDQIEKYGPPPNPAKLSDSRAMNYITKYGSSSWELDALEPAVLSELVKEHVEAEIDWDEWEASGEVQEEGREALRKVSREL